jgi:hypothetical protein
MGAAAADCAPAADRILYAVVLLVVAVGRALRAVQRALARTPAWLHRGVLAGSRHVADADNMHDAAAHRHRAADASRIPPHIAIAGALRSPDHIARIARHACDAGASLVSAHLCGCCCVDAESPAGTVAAALGACSGTRNNSSSFPAVPESDHAPCCTVVLSSTGDSLLEMPPSQTCTDRLRRREQDMQRLFPGTGPAIGAGAAALVEAARWLAATPPCDRGVDVADPYALIDWLDRDTCGLMLPSEPDVLIVFLDDHGLRTLHGFPPWQLRLTQICFVEEAISSFTQDDLLRVACPAAAAPKRFGT